MKPIEWGYFDNPERDLHFTDNQTQYYESLVWQEKRNIRLKIDNYQCAICGSTQNLHVHHKYGLQFDDPEEDLITLCKSCHELVHQEFDKHIEDMHKIWAEERARQKQEWDRHARLQQKHMEEFIDKYSSYDVSRGGAERFTKNEVIRKYWREMYGTIEYPHNPPLNPIREHFAKLYRYEVYMYHISGYNSSQIVAITDHSRSFVDKTLKASYLGGKTMKSIDLSNVQEASDFTRPAPGAYVCAITSAEDVPEKEYLMIGYDIIEGEHKGYYTKLREDHPDWSNIGIMYKSYKSTALGMFKRFCSAVSKSNGKYVFDGDKNADEKTLVKKKIGLVFQEEEYYGNDGEKRTRLKVLKECPVDEVPNQKIPALKTIKEDEGLAIANNIPDDPDGIGSVPW